MLLGTRRALLGRKGQNAAIYLLRDEFTTDDAAPITTPRTCEPGPGTLAITDTGNYSSIAGQRFVYSTPGAVNRLWFSAGQFARQAGRAVCIKQASATVANFHPLWGWATDSRIEHSLLDTELAMFYSLVNIKTGTLGGSFTLPATHAANIDSMTVMVLRSAGGFALWHDGTNWKLEYVDGGSSNANPFISWHTRDKGGSIDWIRAFDLAGPWATDYGIATQQLAGARAPGDTFTHEADCVIEFTVATLPAALQIELRFRIQDATNYWQVTVDSTGALDLDEVVAGVVAQRGTIAGVVAAGERLQLVASGTTIIVSDSIANRITYAAAANFQTETDGELETEGTGGAVTDIVSWPRTLSGAALAELEKYTA